ncbi:MAG: glutamate racemase [Firmicutes bacterium HGW-Firmicutes-14]|nr:MAG: glutamate racemase [Firmicutes bacterium HGW-Firmicutes-14]
MNNQQTKLPIGVFDSGIGGISVLSHLVRCMPNEEYIYLADSAHAPYGTKDREYVRICSVNAARMLLNRGVKALVVACNTATSAAINNIRNEFDIPVIGMEPAVKPAVEAGKSGNIVVMATPLTLKENKFNSLFRRFNLETSIIPLPCPGLVELIEKEVQPEEIKHYLFNVFRDIINTGISSVVLGCTHYCFIRREISEVAGPGTDIFDGNEGTVRQVKRSLINEGILVSEKEKPGDSEVEFMTTGDSNSIIPLCRRFYNKISS